MPLDINTSAPAGNQATSLPAGSALPLPGQVLPQQLLPPTASDASDEAAGNARLSGISNSRLADIRASNLGLAYGALPGGEVGSSKPSLPFAKESAATPQASSNAVNNLDPNGIMAFQLMRQAGEKVFDLQGHLYTTLQKGQLTAMTNSAQAAIKKVDGDMKSSVFKFMGSLAGAGLSFGMGVKGAGLTAKPHAAETVPSLSSLASNTKMPMGGTKPDKKGASDKFNDGDPGVKDAGKSLAIDDRNADQLSAALKKKDAAKKSSHSQDQSTPTPPNSLLDTQSDNPATRQGFTSAAASAGAVLTSATDAIDKTVGGAHESSQADIESKSQDVFQTAFKMSSESQKDAKEKAAKQVEDAIAATKTHFDLVKSTNDRI